MVDSPDDKASGTQGPHQWPGSRCFDTAQSPLDAVQVSRSGLRSGLRWFCTFGLPKPLPGLTYHHPYIGGVRDAMPRGIDRSPFNSARPGSARADGLDRQVLDSSSPRERGRPGRSDLLFLCLARGGLRCFAWRRKTSGRYLAQPRKGAEVIGLPAARIARILPTSGWKPARCTLSRRRSKGLCSAFRIVTKTMVQTKSNFEKGETGRLDRRYLRGAN
jgi:hypothetical protein